MTSRVELCRPQRYTETSQTYYTQLLTRFRFHLWQLFFLISFKKKQNTALPSQPLLFIFRVDGRLSFVFLK